MRYQSATCIADFKRCPMLFFLRHVRRLAPIETPEDLRQGITWHKCLEILKSKPPQDATASEALLVYMNEAYAERPPYIDPVKWETERTMLLYGAIAWDWHWQDDQCETLAREVPFERNVTTTHGRRGIIDRIIRRGNSILINEYKSTAQSIDTGDPYWDRLRRDTQVTLYILEARYVQRKGKLGPNVPKTPLISGVLYDVFHKPLIKPKKLSQADTKKFIATGKYCDDEFVVVDTDPPTINGVIPEVIPGAKEGTYAIRETGEMFAARLLVDLRNSPEKYFARREVARTDAELEAADKEYFKLARIMDFMEQRKLWYKIPTQCDSFGRCAFCPICDYDLDVTKEIPDGFTRR